MSYSYHFKGKAVDKGTNKNVVNLKMSNQIEISTHFIDLPNEIVLIIWKYLTYVEAMRSFGSMKYRRYNRLLEDYCYTSIDFYTTIFSTFQLCCTQILDQYRFHVKIFKIGHRDSYYQLRIFSQYCLSSSSLHDVFPQLETLVLRNVHDSDTNDLLPYLSSISFLDKLKLYKCPLNKASILICESLLKNSSKSQLTNCTLHSSDEKDGLFLCEHLPSSYQPLNLLTYLQIDVRDFATLKYLLIYFPNLSTLDIHFGVDVRQNDEELFAVSSNLCPHLIKLIMRLRKMVVLNFTAIVKFIYLFRHTLVTLHLALIHQDPNFKHSLTYIDGYRLFNDIVIHMNMMKNFSFWIETVCLCDQQMNNIIHSFQTEYWLSMEIGCYYDSLHNVYVIFTSPFLFDLPFVIMNDTIHTYFNHSDHQLNCLTSMLYDKIPGVIILIGENETINKSFFRMLQQGSSRKKTILIKPKGIYQMEYDDDDNSLLTQFNILEIRKRYENRSSDIFVNTTIKWINWMPHIRMLNIDNELLSQLILNNFNIEQFLFLEILIVRQLNNSLNNELLTIINRLGRSSSLCTIHLQQYRIDLQLTINDLYLLLYVISYHFSRFKVITIEFHPDTLFDNHILDELTDIQKKNCQLDYLYHSKTYIELCIAREFRL
ncbi:hypothetical protein I4U23_031453 [Adineta vaga]|nr:hypothetical protein I4U23_031453 [Adineta vaga]